MRKSVLLIIVVMLVGITLLTGCINTEKRDVLKTQDKRVAKFLKEKYGQEFIIGDSSYYRRALGDPYSIRTEITSYDEPPIEFTVMSDEHGNPYGETVFWPELGGVKFGGSYIEMKWQQEASEFYKPIADKIFGEDVLLLVEMSLPRKYYQCIKGEIPSYLDVDMSDEKIFGSSYHSQVFKMIIFKDIKNTDFSIEEKKMEKFLRGLKKEGLIDTGISIVFYDKNIENHVRTYVSENFIRGVNIVRHVEGGMYSSNDYKPMGKEDYYMSLYYKDKEDIKIETIVSKYKKY